MNIVEIANVLYPEDVRSLNITFRTEDNINIEIGKWDVAGVERPSEEELLAIGDSDEFKAKVKAREDAEFNDAIYAQLDLLDLKSIRAIREKNQDYLDMYENEARILRSQLRK